MVTRDPLVVFALLVLWKGYCLGESLFIQEEAVDYGENITLPCFFPTDGSSGDGKGTHDDDDVWSSHEGAVWVREGREDEQVSRMSVHQDGSLSLTNVDRDDSGVYRCEIKDEIRIRIKLEVRVPPPALSNVTIVPSTVLALLLWEVTDTGGYPISHFSARYRLKEPTLLSDHQSEEKSLLDYTWHWVVPEQIKPSVREIDVYQLRPNSSYLFEIWASNHLGAGEITQLETHTQNNEAEIELARHLLEGAETFDTRVWVAAVAVVMGTLVMLALGTCYLLYKECHIPNINLDEHEIMELVPNIILNPGFDDDGVVEGHYERDENCNNRRAMHINNISTAQPYRI